jgi:hypothetical protein
MGKKFNKKQWNCGVNAMGKFNGSVYTVIGCRVGSEEMHTELGEKLRKDGPYWYIEGSPRVLVLNDGRGSSYVATFIKDESMNWSPASGHTSTVIYQDRDWDEDAVKTALGHLFKPGQFGVWTILVDDPVQLWRLGVEHKIAAGLQDETLEERPNAKAATNAYIIRDLLVHNNDLFLYRSHFSVDAGGGFVFHWEYEKRKARIACYNDGKVNLVLKDASSKHLIVDALEDEGYGFAQGVARLYQFLKGEEV